MPVATVSSDFSERKTLKSAPPDGYITVRPLPYGKKLERRENAMKMSMETAEQGAVRKSGTSEKDKIDFELMQRRTREIEFNYCIGDHNLTDAQGKNLDFSNPMTLDALDPRIGTEIEIILDAINGSEEDEEVFTQQHSNTSPEVPEETS